jgi:hypothetical protein
MDVDQHAAAVDVGNLQLNQLFTPHAGRIEYEQPDPMQNTAGALDKPLHFFSGEDLG